MNNNHQHHGHGHSHPELKGKNLLISICLNVGIAVAQGIGGLLSGSLSLLSDAVHNFTDVISLIISYVANRYSQKEASLKKTFGYKHAEIIDEILPTILDRQCPDPGYWFVFDCGRL